MELQVRDTGCGIPESIRARVFDPFFTTKEVGKGTGQGLALVHTIIVQKHAGTIAFESEIGKGTTFIVRLPLGLVEGGNRKMNHDVQPRTANSLCRRLFRRIQYSQFSINLARLRNLQRSSFGSGQVLNCWGPFTMLIHYLKDPGAFSLRHHQAAFECQASSSAVQAIGHVLGNHPLNIDRRACAIRNGNHGIPVDGGEYIFARVNQSGIDPSASESLWLHSLRTASLAGNIASHEQADRDTVLHAFLGGACFTI